MAGGMSLDDIINKIKEAAIETLNEDVVAEVGADFMEHAEADVYGAYEPFVYDRSYRLMQTGTYAVSGGGLQVSITVTHPQGQLIEYGHGNGGYYQYPFNRDDTAWQFLRPRPFYRHTVEALRGGRYKTLLANGLRSRGIPVH